SKSTGDIFRVSKRLCSAAVVEKQAEQLAVLLAETINPGTRIVSALDVSERCLTAFVLGRAILSRRSRCVAGIACVVGAVEMIERGNGQNDTGSKRPHPGEGNECIAFSIGVLQELPRVDVWIRGV